MRFLIPALLGLMLAATPVLAAKRAGPVDSSRAAAPAKHGSAQGGAKSGGHQAAGRHDAKAVAGHGRGGQRVAKAGRGDRHGRVQTAAYTRHRAPARTRFGWTHGLTPAARVQANECPDGTMSTLARGHDDVVRCMPI